MTEGTSNPFIDSGEWQRFLTELSEEYQKFLRMSPQEVDAMFAKSQWTEYIYMVGDTI